LENQAAKTSSQEECHHPLDQLPLGNGLGFAEMLGAGGNSSAVLAEVLHGPKFSAANMLRACLGGPAEAALCLIPARVAKVTRLIGYCSTVLASVSHDIPPCDWYEALLRPLYFPLKQAFQDGQGKPSLLFHPACSSWSPSVQN